MALLPWFKENSKSEWVLIETKITADSEKKQLDNIDLQNILYCTTFL